MAEQWLRFASQQANQLKKFSPNRFTSGPLSTSMSPNTVVMHANRMLGSWPMKARHGIGSGTGVGRGVLNFTHSRLVSLLVFSAPLVMSTRHVPQRPIPLQFMYL